MNANRIEGRWRALGGRLKSRWAKLTDDELKQLTGKQDQIVGALRARYAVLKDTAEKRVNHWLSPEAPERPKQP
jgi:uncharacterized protein YjbJ (UPF0337 family)